MSNTPDYEDKSSEFQADPDRERVELTKPGNGAKTVALFVIGALAILAVMALIAVLVL